MSIFLSYFILGLSLSAPIGPVNAAQLDAGIKKGFWHAWLVGLGALVADVAYMVMVYLGIVHFVDIPFMKTFLWLFGCFVLVYTGVESLLGIEQQSKARKADDTYIKSFFSGFLLSLSNPLTILFWLGIYGSVLAKTAARYNSDQLLLYSAAIILGILLWDITMAAVASSFRRFMTERILKLISVLSGFSLIGFGLYFGYQALLVLFA